MKILIVLSLIAAISFGQELPEPGQCGVSKVQAVTSSRIVNGETAIPHSWPWQLLLVAFYPNNTAKHYCGASLVKTTHVMTAAHCVKDVLVQNLYVYPGIHEFTNEILKPSLGIQVRTAYIHESYSASSLANDGAILRLTRPVELSDKVGLICIAEKNGPAHGHLDPVMATGWGSTTGDPNRPPSSRPRFLQQVALSTLLNSHADCKPLTYVLGIFNTPSKMCAYEYKKGVCFGDSGGPLIRLRTVGNLKYWEQIGIMSGTIDCSFTAAKPDVYCSVKELGTWFRDQIKKSL